MNLKLLLTTILLSTGIMSVFCQYADPCSCDTANSDQRLSGEVFYNTPNSIGSQFFKAAWLSGDIYLTNKTVVTNQNLNYNGVIDELIYLEPNTLTQVMVDKELVSGFTIKDKNENSICHFTKLTIKKEFMKDSSIIYGHVLYTNQLSLLAYRKIVSDEPKKSDMNKYYREVYIPSPMYFFRLPNGKTIGFKKLRRRNLFAWFPDKKMALEKALKEHKQRRFKSEEDLVKVIVLINSIL